MQRETTGDSCKNGRRFLRRFFDENRKIFRDFNFRGFILTAKYRENWKTAKISAYTVLASCFSQIKWPLDPDLERQENPCGKVGSKSKVYT